MNIKSYTEQRDFALLRSYASRVVFLSDIYIQGALNPLDNIKDELILDQLEAFSLHLVEIIYKLYIDEK